MNYGNDCFRRTCKGFKVNKSCCDNQVVALIVTVLQGFSAVTKAFTTVNDRWPAVILSSEYHNYKSFFSAIYLAICDANFCFAMVNIWEHGSNNFRTVLSRGDISKRFENSLRNLHESVPSKGCNYNPLPYCMYGDEIFLIKTWLLRPDPGRQMQGDRVVYNLPHSRVRRTIEDAFGLMMTRWRILHTPVSSSDENIDKLIMAIVVLHHYLLS